MGRDTVRSPHPVSWGEARSLLVLCDVEDRDAITECLTSSRGENKEVLFCLFIHGKRGNGTLSSADRDIPVYADSDLNLWGIPRKDILERISGIEADILINVSRNPVMCYIAARHPGRFKVGLKYPEMEEGYDVSLAITEREDACYLFERILFYLRSIRFK